MRKREELTNPASCMSKARDDEMTFVLIGRDEAAPVAIRAWITERIRIRKNQPNDAQILEAEQCALSMEVESCDWRNTTDPYGGIGDPFEPDDPEESAS